MKKWWLNLKIGVLCSVLAGCSTLQPSTPAGNQALSWQQRTGQLTQIQAWHIRGSVSIQHDNQTDIATVNWQQQAAHYDIALYGPLSIGYVGIAGQPGSVIFTRTNQKAVTATSPEALMQQQLGWQMPVSQLYYWVRGLPAPGAAVTQFDSFHHLTQLHQGGWNIRYLGYTQVAGKDLPRLLTLENPRLKLRLVIREWGV